MLFVQLTLADDETPIFVNFEQVMVFCRSSDGEVTEIYGLSDKDVSWEVTETPEEIIALLTGPGGQP